LLELSAIIHNIVIKRQELLLLTGAANYYGDIRRPFVGRDALGTPLIADL